MMRKLLASFCGHSVYIISIEEFVNIGQCSVKLQLKIIGFLSETQSRSACVILQ